MNMKEIEAIVTAARSSSFYEAAYTLNYSPSVISKHIANAEHELGVTLFVRGKRSAILSLTKEGQTLLPQFMCIHEEWRKLQDSAETICKKPGGTLKIGTGHHIASLGMDEILADFFSTRPDISIMQTKLDFESQIHALYSGQQDGVFILVQDGSPNSITLNSVINDPKVEAFLLVREYDMYLGVSEAHFPESVISAPFSAFHDYMFVFHSNQELLRKAGTMTPFIKLSKSAGFELNIFYADPRDTSAYYLATQRKIAIPSLRGAFKYPGIRFIRIEDWDSCSMSFFITLRTNRNKELAQFKKSVGLFLKGTD